MRLVRCLLFVLGAIAFTGFCIAVGAVVGIALGIGFAICVVREA